MNIQAKLIEKFQTQRVSDTFQKREFVVEFAENPQYPEFIKFELIQANCEQLEKFNIGEELNISFNLKGRKWTDKNGQVVYFNSLQAWRLEKAGSGSAAPTTPSASGESKDWQPDSFSADDDLPF
jgi:hypothetical protein